MIYWRLLSHSQNVSSSAESARQVLLLYNVRVSRASVSISMTSAETTARGLDLAARGVDLTVALSNATNSSNPLFRGAWEIGQWLGREKLNQHELQDCMDKSKGLVFPNHNGQQILLDIVRGVERKPIGPLFLEQSGSLGRLMASDPNLSWMVTTATGLFQFHRDDRFVTETVTALIASSQPDTNTTAMDGTLNLPGFSLYDPSRTQLRPVVSKIISSVWYNVVNAGCDTVPLPAELMSICHNGHYLDPDDFARIACIINTRRPSKAILRSNHLLRNITLWLLLHYDGLLVVNVGGKIVFERQLGNTTKELELNVKMQCLPDEGCDGLGTEKYEIWENVAGKFEHFMTGYSQWSFEQHPQSGIRQKLYDMPFWEPRESRIWDAGIRLLIRCTAQEMMRWLLGVPILAQEGFSQLGFSVSPDGSRQSPNVIGTLLKRVPSMINLSWGHINPPAIIFAQPPYDFDLVESSPTEFRSKLMLLVRYFPALQDTVRKIQPHCGCSECWVDHLRTGPSEELKSGCLKRIALEQILCLIAHGIADGFDISDVSAVSRPESMVAAAANLLLELCAGKIVRWDLWFGLAATVFLGCPFQEPPGPEDPAFGGTAYAAIQYGNLAAIAPWLDLSSELKIEGCFHLIGSRGRLGALTSAGTGDSTAKFHGVEENFAIIETESTQDTSMFNSHFKKELLPRGTAFSFSTDRTPVTSDVILTAIHENFYRLMLRVKTPSHWRIVDPSDAMNAVIRDSTVLPTCSHETSHPITIQDSVKAYTFEELLGRWPDTVQPQATTSIQPNDQKGIVHVSCILDTNFKRNIALALTVCTTNLQSPHASPPTSLCPVCIFNRVREMETCLPLRSGEGGDENDRYILNHALRSGKSILP